MSVFPSLLPRSNADRDLLYVLQIVLGTREVEAHEDEEGFW